MEKMILSVLVFGSVTAFGFVSNSDYEHEVLMEAMYCEDVRNDIHPNFKELDCE